MTVRLLHSADLHLDAPLRALAMTDDDLRARVATASRGALERMVAHCVAEGVAGLLLAGDVFDRAVRSVDAAAFFAQQMERLERAGCRVFMIQGNHDHENAAAGRLPLPGNVTVFGTEGGGATLDGLGEGLRVAIHGKSYGARSADAALAASFPPPTPGAVNIGLLHTSLAGAAAHDPYAPCSVAELAAQGYDYWALGHVHARAVHAERPWVVMPGTPQGRHVNEPGPKSATEITLKDGAVASIREIPTAEAVFARLDVPCGPDDAEQFARLCRRALEREAEATLAEGQALVARLRATGDAATLRRLRHHHALWRERAALAAREIGDCWLEGLDIAAAPAASGALCGGPIAEIAAAMREAAPSPATRHALRALLDESLDILSPARRRALAPEEADREALLDRLAAEAIEEMVAAFGEGGEDGA